MRENDRCGNDRSRFHCIHYITPLRPHPTFPHINTLPSGHVESRNWYPMRWWSVTSFYVFLHDILHICQVVWFTFHFKVTHSLMQDAWVLSYKQTDQSWLPIFRTIRLQQRDNSFRYSVFLQMQSWLCIGVFCKMMIFCVSYMQLHILMSLIIVTMKTWTVTETSLQLVHINNCDLLLVHWPHNFHTHFSSHL